MTDFAPFRPLVFSIAYRMLGSVAEAEDIAQEALLRAHRETAAGAEVASPKAYITTIGTRLAIDHLRSARVRREQYVGPWLPEPLLVDEDADVARAVERSDSLSMAFLVLLERLAPVERAVFLLREVFDYDYAEIAEVVDKSEDNCRQILVRARRRVDADRPRFEASRDARDALAERFFAAAQEGDVEGLVALLGAEARLTGDGGGKAAAFPKPIEGARAVARALAAIFRRGGTRGMQVQPEQVNGQPGVLLRDAEGAIVAVMALDIAGGAVAGVRSVVNPDKLGHLGPVSAAALKRSRDAR
jgi:RNA polymerase sigma-70 factor (ECF subfamily)